MSRIADIGNGTGIAAITFNAIPEQDYMFKYERLGQMAIENRRQYCRQHGYTFIHDVDYPDDRPACWAKIPAILQALENHRWVLWADSDTLIFDPQRRLEDFCDPDYDLIVQSPEEYFRYIGIDKTAGLARMPINTGVFLIQSTSWSRWFLRQAYDQTQFVVNEKIWSGIGEQEAMIDVLHKHPGDLRRISYVNRLQNHPKFYRKGDMFVHFYGHYARHHIPLGECEEVIARWETANATGQSFPDDIARFHWCCIQNKEPDSPVLHGELERYLYNPGDIGIQT